MAPFARFAVSTTGAAAYTSLSSSARTRSSARLMVASLRKTDLTAENGSWPADEAGMCPELFAFRNIGAFT
jgi:hypothetical protein